MEPMDGTNLCNHCGHGTHGLEPKQPIQPNATNPHDPLSVLMCSERAACIASRIHVRIIIVHVFSSRVLHTDCCQSIFHINFDRDIFLDVSIMTSPEMTRHADLKAAVLVSGSPFEIKSFFDQIAPPALRAGRSVLSPALHQELRAWRIIELKRKLAFKPFFGESEHLRFQNVMVQNGTADVCLDIVDLVDEGHLRVAIEGSGEPWMDADVIRQITESQLNSLTNKVNGGRLFNCMSFTFSDSVWDETKKWENTLYNIAEFVRSPWGPMPQITAKDQLFGYRQCLSDRRCHDQWCRLMDTLDRRFGRTFSSDPPRSSSFEQAQQEGRQPSRSRSPHRSRRADEHHRDHRDHRDYRDLSGFYVDYRADGDDVERPDWATLDRDPSRWFSFLRDEGCDVQAVQQLYWVAQDSPDDARDIIWRYIDKKGSKETIRDPSKWITSCCNRWHRNWDNDRDGDGLPSGGDERTTDEPGDESAERK